MKASKRLIRRVIGRRKAQAHTRRANANPTRLLWSLPGLLTNLIGTSSAQHRFLYQARLVDGRTPAQAISDGDDFKVLRHLRAIASGNFP